MIHIRINSPSVTYLNPVAFCYWQSPSVVPIQGNSIAPNPNSNQTGQDSLVLSYWTNEHPVGLSIIGYVPHPDVCERYHCHRCVCNPGSPVTCRTVRGPMMIYRYQCDHKCQSVRDRERESPHTYKWLEGIQEKKEKKNSGEKGQLKRIDVCLFHKKRNKWIC